MKRFIGTFLTIVFFIGVLTLYRSVPVQIKASTATPSEHPALRIMTWGDYK